MKEKNRYNERIEEKRPSKLKPKEDETKERREERKINVTVDGG